MSLRHDKYLNDDEQHAAKQRIETTDKRPVNPDLGGVRPFIIAFKAQ